MKAASEYYAFYQCYPPCQEAPCKCAENIREALDAAYAKGLAEGRREAAELYKPIDIHKD